MASSSGATHNDTTPSRSENILQVECSALKHCLKDAVIKTGQVYSFYAEASKLGIGRHVPNPPRSLTTTLGRDIEEYDQLCDSIEAQLLRAIRVLERDLRKEAERTAAEERRKQTEALMLPPPPPEVLVEVLAHPSTDGNSTNTRNSPILNALPGRRPSAISISSLHRPPFPLKLDLSSTSMRITEEEVGILPKGPTSPVTLAPKSARPIGPNESFPELMAAFAHSIPLDVSHGSSEIDLTLPENVSLGIGLGDSLDKPIVLDLEAMDIEMANMTDQFGDTIETSDSGGPHDGLFSPILDSGEGDTGERTQQNESSTLTNFQIDSSVNDELFKGFTTGGELHIASGASIPQPHSSSMLSPGSLLAQFSSPPDLLDVKNSSTNPVLQDTGESFDLNSIDITNLTSGFFSVEGSDNFMMETLLHIDTGVEVGGDGHTTNPVQI